MTFPGFTTTSMAALMIPRRMAPCVIRTLTSSFHSGHRSRLTNIGRATRPKVCVTPSCLRSSPRPAASTGNRSGCCTSLPTGIVESWPSFPLFPYFFYISFSYLHLHLHCVVALKLRPLRAHLPPLCRFPVLEFKPTCTPVVGHANIVPVTAKQGGGKLRNVLPWAEITSVVAKKTSKSTTQKTRLKLGQKGHIQGLKTGWVKSRAPRDLAASTRPCLLCKSCTYSFPEGAGRCPPLRTPCTCS